MKASALPVLFLLTAHRRNAEAGKRLQSLAYDRLHAQTQPLLAEAASGGQLNSSMIIYLPFHAFSLLYFNIVPSS